LGTTFIIATYEFATLAAIGLAMWRVQQNVFVAVIGLVLIAAIRIPATCKLLDHFAAKRVARVRGEIWGEVVAVAASEPTQHCDQPHSVLAHDE
jgi:hypothetical protein